MAGVGRGTAAGTGGDGGLGRRRVLLVLEGDFDVRPEELDRITHQLRGDLLRLDVEDAELLAGGAVPAGAKSPDAVSIGALAVTLSAGVLEAMVLLVTGWLRSRPVRSVKVTLGEDSLELSDAAEADQERLIRAFLDRHTPP